MTKKTTPNKKQEQEWLKENFWPNTPRLLTEKEKGIVLSEKTNDSEILKVYNDAFNQELTQESFVDGVKEAVVKKLNKLAGYKIE